MARIEEIERRLNNWARWKLGAGGGGLGYGNASIWNAEGRALYREAVIPTVDCEAEETGRAVATLEEPLRMTVERVYVHPGSVSQKSYWLGIGEAQLHARIWLAHRKLAAWFSEKQMLARAERARVESLKRSTIYG